MASYIFNIGLYHYLIFALIIFLLASIGVVICKNVIKVLICLEFIIMAININFIAFASYSDSVNLHGFVFSLFYIAIGAVETSVALLIFYLMYREKKSVDIEKYKELNG